MAIALAYLLPLDSWFNLQSLPSHQVSLVISLLAIYTLVSQQGGLIDAAFRSDGRYAQGTALANVVRFMEMALALIGVCLGGDLVTAASTLLVGRLLGTVWMWLMFRRASQWLSLGYSKARWDTIQIMLRPAIAFMALPMSQALIFPGMTLSVGVVLGSVAVVVFTTSRTVTRIVIQFIHLVNSAVWPELSNAFGSANLLLARKLHQKASLFSLWLSILAATVLAFVGLWLLQIWTGRQILIDKPLFYSMLLIVISSSFWQSISIVLMATKHGGFAKISLVSSILAIILADLVLKFIVLVRASIALLLINCLIGFYVM